MEPTLDYSGSNGEYANSAILSFRIASPNREKNAPMPNVVHAMTHSDFRYPSLIGKESPI